MFSEKCDNYKETRHKLQKKVKKRDEKILALEERLGQLERILGIRNDPTNIPSFRGHH